MILRFFIAIVGFCFSFPVLSQTLTISSATTSGSNWSLSGGVLTVTGTANIQASVIQNALTNGNLSIVGTTTNFIVNVNQAISSSAASSLTIGANSNTGDITISSAISVGGSLALYGGNLGLSANLTSTQSGTGQITVAATGYIATNTNGLSFTTSGGAILFTSDTDASNSGSIILERASFASNGGNITLGGGNLTGSGYAVGMDYTLPNGATPNFRGIWLHSSSINAGGGNIVLRGKGAAVASSSAYYCIGIDLISVSSYSGSGNQIQTLGSGIISLNGLGGNNANATTHGSGINFFSNSGTHNITSVNGTIELNGSSGIGSASKFVGINHDGGDVNIVSTSGAVNLTGIAGTGTTEFGFSFAGNVNIGGNGTTNSTGNVTLSGDRFNSTGTYVFRNTGSVTIQPEGTSFNQGFSFDTRFSLIGTKTGLTIGKASNSAAVTIVNATTIAGPISLLGGNLTLTGALTATNSDILLQSVSPGAVTQAAAITANRLNLSGTGSFTLQHASNNVGVLAGGTSSVRLGNLSYKDAGILEIGSVTTAGIFSSGTVLVETETGNLTLAQSINTSSTSTSAITLNASRALAAGNGSGGNILVSGSPTITYGSGGMAKLFSGYSVASTGLTTLAGGSANTRAPFDENSTITPTLTANNTYAIYRVLEGTGDLTIVSSGGDAEGSTWTYNNGTITTINSPANILNTAIQTKLASADLTIEANKITFSANITGGTANNLKFLSKTHIVNSSATTITTQGGNVLFASNVDDATDGESTTNGYIQLRNGITINSNGGNITFGGGNTSGTDYSLGSDVETYTEGIRFDAIIALNSGNGNIAIRGKSYARAVEWATGASGVGFYFFSGATGTITSGSGTITIDGFSQTSSSTYASGFYCMHNLTITSANTTSDAIKILGKATGASGEAWGIESEGTLSILATEVGGGITISTSKQLTDNFDAVFRGQTNLLAVSGPIDVKTGQISGTTNGYLYLSGHMYVGSKAGSGITSSSSNINIQVDRFYYNGGIPKIATSGQVTVQSNATSFGAEFYTSWMDFNQNNHVMSALTIGKQGNSQIVYINSAFNVAGPITVHGGYIYMTSSISSSANGDILLKGIATTTNSVNIASGGITKTAGTGTLTLQGNTRVINYGTLSATGTASLNVIFWSDLDNTNNDGGVSQLGTISTNGGHVWLGGSSTTGGSYTWNGLTVGDGPSIGGSGYNANALDIWGPITTNGGDVLAWAGAGYGGTNGIVTNDGWQVNVGNGDIILITDYILGSGPSLFFRQNGGTFTLVPNEGSFPNTLDWSPYYGPYGSWTGWNFPGDFNFLWIENPTTLTNLTIGRYEGMLNNGTPVVFTNSTPITIATEMNTAGNIAIYGGTITLNNNLSTTNNGHIGLYSDNAIAGLTSQRNVTAAGTFTYAPLSTTFASAVSYPITNLNVSSTGLTIGKSTNTANITVAGTTSINGPIMLYGGDLTVNAALTTTNNGTGDITLIGTKLLGSNPITLATGRILTANLSGTSEFTGDISGTTISLTKSGAGTLTLNPTNALVFQNANVTAGGLTIAASKQLTVSGTLTNDGTLTLKNGVTYVPSTSGTSVAGSGTFNVEKQLTGNTGSWTNTNGRFWYMGVPMVSVARNNYGTYGASTNRLWSYTESTKSYTELTDGTALLSAGTGYVHRRDTDGTLTFSANGASGLYRTDFTASNLSKTAGNTAGVHLISNPYMAYLDWHAIYTASTNIDPTFYVRTNNTNNISAIISYNAGTQLATNNSSVTATAAQLRYIAPMQSIWVRVLGNAGATGTVNMTRGMLSHQSGNVGLKSSTIFPTLARVNLVDGNNFDQLLVYLNSDMSNEVDEYDSEKMSASGTAQIYTMSSNKKLVMNGLRNNKKKVSVPLYLELPETKSYTLQLSEFQLEDGLILLEDKQEGTIQDFTINENYTFFANSGLLQNRFVLHFILPNAELTTQGPSNNWVEEETSYAEGGDLTISNDDKGNIQITLNQAEDQKVEGTVSVTDMNGKEVYQGQLDGIITDIELNVPSGIYYLTVQSGTLIEKKKVFIQD